MNDSAEVRVTEAPVLILAAGASRRMGRAKALLPWGEGCLLDRALVQARCLGDETWVIGGRYYPLMRYRCRVQPRRWLFNPDWPEGMASSLRLGLQAMPASAAGAFVVLVDQPLVDEESLSRLRKAARAAPRMAAAADYQGRPGAPAYLPRAIWPAVMAVQGDRGAAAALRQSGARLLTMPGAVADVDTPADWRRYREQGGSANRLSDEAAGCGPADSVD